MSSGQPPFDHLAEIEQQVPAIRYLHGLTGADGGTTSIVGCPVAGDHGDLLLPVQPCCRDLGRTVGQQFDDAPPLEVDRDRAVGAPLADRPA